MRLIRVDIGYRHTSGEVLFIDPTAPIGIRLVAIAGQCFGSYIYIYIYIVKSKMKIWLHYDYYINTFNIILHAHLNFCYNYNEFIYINIYYCNRT